MLYMRIKEHVHAVGHLGLRGSPLEMCWIHASKILTENGGGEGGGRKTQVVWGCSLGHHTTVLVAVLSLLSHKSFFRKTT